MEMRCIAGENDHGSGRIRFQSVGVEFVSEANIKNTRDDGVSSGCLCGINFTPRGTRTLTTYGPACDG